MIILITGAFHTGKTLLAQRMLEQYKYPYLSIDPPVTRARKSAPYSRRKPSAVNALEQRSHMVTAATPTVEKSVISLLTRKPRLW